MVERTGEKGWFLACNSALYFALVRYGVQAKQRLAEATAKVRFGSSEPWDFSCITSGLSYISSLRAGMRAVKLKQ